MFYNLNKIYKKFTKTSRTNSDVHLPSAEKKTYLNSSKSLFGINLKERHGIGNESLTFFPDKFKLKNMKLVEAVPLVYIDLRNSVFSFGTADLLAQVPKKTVP